MATMVSIALWEGMMKPCRFGGLRSSTCFLIDLNRGLVLLDTNDLTNKQVMTDTTLRGQYLGVLHGLGAGAAYQLVHGTTDHVLGHDDRAGDRKDRAMVLRIV